MSYRHLFRIASAFLGLACVPAAFAGNAYGTVGNVLVGRLGNQVYVQLVNATVSGWPCASSVPNWGYAFLLDAPGGRDMLATVLAAKAAGQLLQVVGNGTCTIDPTLENVSYVVTW
jgi:hypothetical protein